MTAQKYRKQETCHRCESIFDDLLDWGVPVEQIEAIIAVKSPTP